MKKFLGIRENELPLVIMIVSMCVVLVLAILEQLGKI